MKKNLVSLLTAAAVLSSTAIPAAAWAKSGDNHDDSAGWERSLGHVKNKKSKEAIEAALKKYREHGRQWSDDDDNEQKHQTSSAAERVAADKAVLQIDFGGADTINSVTRALDSLPNKGKNGSRITWASNNTSVLSNDGKTVNRPVNGDINVVLTATITYGNISVTRAFVLTVKLSLSDTQKVAADKAALAINYASGDSAGSVTKPLSLPTACVNGSAIVWISSAPSIVSADGKTINRPTTGDASVVLTAILTYNGSSEFKQFTVTVKQQVTDSQKVAADKAELTITFRSGDSAGSVTGPLQLSQKGANGSSITWISSSPQIISTDGKQVNPPVTGSGDTAVVLTAILTLNGITDSKSFTLIVKPQLTDVQKIAADKASLAISYSGSDYASSVTGPITLPAKGIYGSDIIWISSNPSVISGNGKVVIRPASGSSDAVVTMTAIVISGAAFELKTFNLIVKAR